MPLAYFKGKTANFNLCNFIQQGYPVFPSLL